MLTRDGIHYSRDLGRSLKVVYYQETGGYDKSMRELEGLTGPETNNAFLIEIDGSKT
jgi:hypothetical protein